MIREAKVLVTAVAAVALLSGCALTSPPKAVRDSRNELAAQAKEQIDDIEKDFDGVVRDLAAASLEDANARSLAALQQAFQSARNAQEGAFLMQSYERGKEQNRLRVEEAAARYDVVSEKFAVLRAQVDGINQIADGEALFGLDVAKRAQRLGAKVALDAALTEIERKYGNVVPAPTPAPETRY